MTRWALHDDVVCGRHRRWISKYQAQPDLTAQPEILTAHRRHRRLIRRHGRDTVMRAFRDARHICLGWRLDGIPDDGYGHRMEIFHGPGWRDRDDDENQHLRRRRLPAIGRAHPATGQPLLARAHPRQRLALARGVRNRNTPHRRTRLHLGNLPAHPLAPRPGRPAARMAIRHPPAGIRTAPARASPEPARNHPNRQLRPPLPRPRGNCDMTQVSGTPAPVNRPVNMNHACSSGLAMTHIGWDRTRAVPTRPPASPGASAGRRTARARSN